MKKKIALTVLAMLLIGGLIFGVTGNSPEDKVICGQFSIEAGRMSISWDLYDERGSYAGNHLKVKFLGDVDGISIEGVEIYEPDPNYWLVTNAIPDPMVSYDPNDPNHFADPNIVTRLSGDITIIRTWPPGHYEIGVWVFDSWGNSDCKWMILDVSDTTPPTVGGCRPE